MKQSNILNSTNVERHNVINTVHRISIIIQYIYSKSHDCCHNTAKYCKNSQYRFSSCFRFRWDRILEDNSKIFNKAIIGTRNEGYNLLHRYCNSKSHDCCHNTAKYCKNSQYRFSSCFRFRWDRILEDNSIIFNKAIIGTRNEGYNLLHHCCNSKSHDCCHNTAKYCKNSQYRFSSCFRLSGNLELS